MTMIEAKVLLDSVWEGKRLTTLQMTYPRFVHAEYMTHRVFSRNAASSRAIPAIKMIAAVEDDPVIPIHWGAAEKGMQAHKELSLAAQANCQELWLDARDKMVDTVQGLLAEGLHKQIANRLLEPWMYITVIHSATSWQNFFDLRCDGMAEPHMRALAYAMRHARDRSNPLEREWHMPLTGFPGDEKLNLLDKQLVSVARCARVSYLTHDGTRNVQNDLELAQMLRTNGHLSPWEHVSHGCDGNWGNFKGWRQLRWYVERGISWAAEAYSKQLSERLGIEYRDPGERRCNQD